MFAPGIVGVTVGLLILLTVRDSPEKIGYPPIEIVAKAKKEVLHHALKATAITKI